MNTGIVMINYKIASGWRMTFEVRARALLAGRNCRLHRCWGSQILAVPLSGWVEAILDSCGFQRQACLDS